MKAKISRMWRSGIAMLLALCLVVGFFPSIAFAAETDKETITYVSIGDSMTNGYGLDGYDGSSGIVNYAMQTYGNQFAAWLAGYTGEITDDQVVFEGDDAVVDHRQLAMSGLRAEDLHWILELDYTDKDFLDEVVSMGWDGDDWENSRFDADRWYGEFGFAAGDYRTNCDVVDPTYRFGEGAARILRTYHTNENNAKYFQSSYATDALIDAAVAGINEDDEYPGEEDVPAIGASTHLQIATEFFQKSVEDADIISLALGNTNFGTYMLNEIMDVVMYNDLGFSQTYDIERVFDLADLDPAMEAKVRELIDEYDVIIDQLFSGLAGGDAAKMEALRNIIIYCAVSYIVNYIGSVDAILALNPDADIIQVALMNVYAVEDASVADQTTLGDMVDILYGPINKFLPALPTVMQATGDARYQQATFYFAEADTVGCMVEVFGDDFYTKDGEDVEYPGLLNDNQDYDPNLGSTVRDRIITEIVGGETFRLMNNWGINVDTDLKVEEIAAYDMMTPEEKAAYAAQNADRAKSIALYLAFENASIRAGEKTVTMDSLAALGGLESAFGGIIGSLQQNATAYGKDKYLDAAAAVAAVGASKTLTETVNTKMASYGVTVDLSITADQIADLALGESDEDVCKAIAESAENAVVNAAMPTYKAGVIEKVCDEAIPGMLAMIKSYSNGLIDIADSQYATLLGVDVNEKEALAYAFANDFANDLEKLSTSVPSADLISGILEDQNMKNAAGAVATITDANIYAATLAYIETAMNEDLYDTLYGYIFAGVPGAVRDNVNKLAYLLGLPETLSNAMVEDSTLSGILCMNARCLIGTGIGGHPSEAGHDALALAVVDSFASGHTSKDETVDNLKPVLEGLVEAIKKYGPEAGKAVWERWVEMGYVKQVEDYIDELIDTVEIRYDHYANVAIPAIEAAIDALKGEKDILVTKLDDLNAQLAAKKTQLAEVLAGIEIGSIHMPEINIDPIGGNEQTEVPAYDCEVEGEGVVAELEAAIRDIEHAIAVVEALIADVDADLADMAKLAAQIADAVKELNKTYNSIVDAAEDVYDAFKAIEEVLTNDADVTIEAVTSAFDAARSTALAALDVLEVAMGYARELDADILAEVDNIVDLAESLYNKFISEDSLEAYINAIVNRIQPQLTEEEIMAIGITAMILKELAPEAIAYAEEQLPIKIEELKAECRTKIEALIEEYKPQILEAKAELEEKWESEIKPEIEKKYAELKAQIEAEYEAAVAALEAKRAELIAELVAAEAKLEATVEELKGEAEAKIEAAVAPLKAQIARLEKDIATVTADLAHAAGHLETALKLAYQEIEIAVMALYNEAMAKLNAAIEALKAQLKKDIEALKNALKNMIEDALESILDEVKKTVEELKNALIAMGIETIEELVDALTALFNKLLYQATHADLVIDHDFKYVALGDGSTVAYAEALNAYLAAEAAENGINSIDFVNEAEVGNSIAAEADGLSAEIANADLITLGFSQTDMLANAITAGELDWAALIGEKAVPYVEEALAKVTAEIDAQALPAGMKEWLKAVVEAYAYNVVEYTVTLPELIYKIREVNEDAVVIVVGMYNPIDGITAFGYDLSAFAEYFDYLIEAADAYGIGLAMLTNELDYVTASEVEIEKTQLGLGDLNDLFAGDLSAMYPSANGDAYIAERIENALNLIFTGLWGDANGDGVVLANDAMLVLQYSVGLITADKLNLAVCDVNGDGDVLANDAMLILQYSVGLITAFPVEG